MNNELTELPPYLSCRHDFRCGFTIMDVMSHNQISTPGYKAWKLRTATYMHNKYMIGRTTPLITDPCAVTIRTAHDVRADADNLIKPLIDAVTLSGVWSDDRLVKHLVVIKGRVCVPVHMTIGPLELAGHI